jgi:metallo-beta-lactamase family protein
MRILHHGAVNGVTGSCHELTLDSGSGLLIDCGLFQGTEVSQRSTANASRQAIDFPIAHIQALLATHVHIDHVGRIPYLLAVGFKGPIYCSEPSAKLLPLVLQDALKIGVTRNEDMIGQFMSLIASRIKPIPYGQWLTVFDGLDVRLQPAGHILGSAYVECRCRENDSDEDKTLEPTARPITRLTARPSQKKTNRIVFSGDLGAPYAPLLPAPKSPYGTDILVIESTYGDRLHEGRAQRRKRLQKVIEKAVKNRGTVLIPAFSIGRTQELLYELEGIIHDEKRRDEKARDASAKGHQKVAHQQHPSPWAEIDIIVDSPLASRFTAVYRELQPFWDKEALRVVAKGRHPLSFERLLTVDSHADHERVVRHLARSGRPAIVLAASGMCAGGRIINYLKALLPDSRSDVLFVGYQAAGTPGRDIQRYGPKGGYVYLDQEKIAIRAAVHSISGYSAHADQKDLVNFVKRMRKKPREIRIIHGDDEAKTALQKQLSLLYPSIKVHIP